MRSWRPEIARGCWSLPIRSSSGCPTRRSTTCAASIEVPTLVLVAGESPELFQVCAQNVVAALPDGRSVVLHGQGHSAEMFAPEVVAEQVLAFLDGAESPRAHQPR